MPKILTVDLERLPGLAFVWRTGETRIGIDMMRKPSRTCCWAAKWYGKKGVEFGAEWEDENFLVPLFQMLEESDAVVTFNGDSFDFAHLRGEAVQRGLYPMKPPTSIDLYKTVRGLGLDSGKLAWALPLLGIGKKVETGGMSLWHGVYDGDPKAQARMKRYNISDVLGTERLYTRLLPYIRNHPHLGERGSCPACGSLHVNKQGWKNTRVYRTQQLQCQSCGHWYGGAREKRA